MLVIEAIRQVVTRITGSNKMYGVSDEAADCKGQAASDLVKNVLLLPTPSLICRFGWNELNIVTGYCSPPSLRNYVRYFRSELTNVGWTSGAVSSFACNAGFFPLNRNYLARFAEMTLADMQEIDVLCTWLIQEKVFAERLRRVKRIPLKDLEPFHHPDPWTTVLEDKRILVVHPFAETIRQQYEKRSHLFANPLALPRFDLHIVKAVQSIAGNTLGYRSWFDALDDMKDKIGSINFDIAILGCGAYGLPLAAHVKRLGKKAVHMGGATQLLFGIKGKRWEELESYKSIMNEHWVKPLPEDCPAGYLKVENGCYW